MENLEINTGDVNAVASRINKLVTNMGDLASIISGDNVNNEDGFDFASAKSTILKSVKNCQKKIENSEKIMTITADSHDKIQNTLKYQVPKSSWEN